MSRLSAVKVFARRSVSVVVMLLLLFAFGCSSKEQELVGTWNNTAIAETFEFRADKTGTITAVDKQQMAFSWQERAKHKYTLEIMFRGQKTVLNGIIQDKTLILENSMGKETYRKKQ